MPRELICDPELTALLPDAGEASERELERQLKENGRPLDPIRVWRDKNIIVDGHRRHRLCKKLGLPFSVEYLDFDNRDAVKLWIHAWQVARRNMAGHHQAVSLAAMARLFQAQGKSVGQAVAETAGAAGLSERQVFRKLARVEAMGQLVPEFLKPIESGAIRINDDRVAQLAKLDDEQQRACLRAWQTDEYPSFAQAMDAVLNPPTEEPEPTTDAASVKPPKPPSPPKPPKRQSKADRLAALVRQLGEFKRGVCDMREEYPEPTKKILSLLNKVGDLLAEWKGSK